jgi:NAD(P)-dependent dehydrogenase (short-subunit alcohol dehydrogenase family)
MAGRVVSLLSGPAYTAAKHGLVAMSHSINMQECVNGIRSCVVLPGEVATPILDSGRCRSARRSRRGCSGPRTWPT